jgi:hypothetical protein
MTESLPSLGPYPRLAECFDDDFRDEYARKHQAAPSRVYRILCDPNPRCEQWREEVDGLLATGARVGLLNREMMGKLRSGDDGQFLGAVSELETAKFFDDRGFPLTPRPRGRAGRTGDMQLGLAPPLFVEVKALLDRPAESVEQRLSSKLWKYAREVELRFTVHLKIITPAADFRGRTFQHWLEALLLRGSGAEDTDAVYRDKSGFEVAVKSRPHNATASHVLCTQIRVGWSQTKEYVKASIRASYQQLPEGHRPALVVLRPWLTEPVDQDDMVDALYGSAQVVLNTNTGHVDSGRVSDGVFRPGRNERLSAVGVLRDVGIQRDLALDVYHSELARHPLDWQLLHGPNIRHLLRIDRHELAWKE